MNHEVHELLDSLTAARYARLHATGTGHDARADRLYATRQRDLTSHSHGFTFNKRLIYADPDVEVYAVGEEYALDYLSNRRPRLPSNVEEFIVSMIYNLEPRVVGGYSFTSVEQTFDRIREAFSESVNGSDLLGQLSEITDVETGEDDIRDECFFEILMQAALSVEQSSSVSAAFELEYDHRYRYSIENDDRGILYEVIDVRPFNVRSDRRPRDDHSPSSGLSPEVTDILQERLSSLSDEEVETMHLALRLLLHLRAAISRYDMSYGQSDGDDRSDDPHHYGM